MVSGPLAVIAGQSISSLSVSDDDTKKVSAVIALKYRVGSDSSSQTSNKSEKKDAEYSELIDARDEDSFTLDTFDKLIRKARRANKSFLLARVTTQNSHDVNHEYYSHYPAHQLNKILFRTQPEAGLLHRMRCRNPRNNMEIIGQVEYYEISPETVDKALEEAEMERGREQLNRIERSGSLYQSSAHGSQSSISVQSDKPLVTSSVSLPRINADEPVVFYEATFFATDDDFLNRAEVREHFKNCSVADDDYLLFTLYNPHASHPVMSMQGNEPITNNRIHDPTYQRHWYNLFGMFMPVGPSCLTSNTGFLNAKGWLLLSMLGTAGMVLAFKFLIPKQFFLVILAPSVALWLLLTVLLVRVDSMY